MESPTLIGLKDVNLIKADFGSFDFDLKSCNPHIGVLAANQNGVCSSGGAVSISGFSSVLPPNGMGGDITVLDFFYVIDRVVKLNYAVLLSETKTKV